jgi:hypothetical protein
VRKRNEAMRVSLRFFFHEISDFTFLFLIDCVQGGYQKLKTNITRKAIKGYI